jgi:serine/threonine-protein kinase RsbW
MGLAVTDAERFHELTLTSDPNELEGMRAWLRRTLALYRFAVDDETAVLTAVGELCTNSIKHAYDGRGDQPIRLSVTGFDDRIVVEVEDFGASFDEARYVAPDLAAAPEHGMGLFLARQLVDSLTSDVARASGTRWTLVKYRAGYRPPNTERNSMS